MKNLTKLLVIYSYLILIVSCSKERCYDCSQEHIKSSIDSTTYTTEWEICYGYPIVLNKVAKAEEEGATCIER